MKLGILVTAALTTIMWLTVPVKVARPQPKIPGATVNTEKIEGNKRRLLETKQCPSCNLSGANLSGANLSGAKLKGANLSGANLSGAKLKGANLSGANLSGANLSGTEMSDGKIHP